MLKCSYSASSALSASVLARSVIMVVLFLFLHLLLDINGVVYVIFHGVNNPSPDAAVFIDDELPLTPFGIAGSTKSTSY